MEIKIVKINELFKKIPLRSFIKIIENKINSSVKKKGVLPPEI